MKVLWSALGLAAATGLAAADTVNIGFESLTHGDVVTTQYSHLGATFSGDPMWGEPRVVEPDPFSTSTHYYDKPLAGQGDDKYLGPGSGWGYVNIAFDPTIRVTEFSAVGLDIGENGFRIEAYDGATLVDSVEAFGTGTGEGLYFDLSVAAASGFDRIRIGQALPYFLGVLGDPTIPLAGGDSAYAIDDLSYTYVVVPLPAGVWAGLLGLGVAAGVSRMRRS